MRKPAILLFLNMLCSVSYGQFPASVDSLYTFIRSNSVLRTTIEWKQVDERFRDQIGKAQSLGDTMKCFVTVLESLNDVHSQIYLNNRYFGNYPQFDEATLAWLKPLNDYAMSQTNLIHTASFTDGIGYIRVPSMQVSDRSQINHYAQSLYDSIVQLSEKSKRGFIIDLRLNGGGNLYPMLSGLSLFLGNRIIGHETGVDDGIARTWEIVNGNFVIGGYQTSDIKAREKAELQSVPIVVLIGPVTKSSGSMTAIAFRGRPNTLFVGEPTANGYTTSNGYFQFAPNLTLNFATNYVADRNMNIYKTTVNPDVIINHGDNFESLMEDEKIKSAINWLIAR